MGMNVLIRADASLEIGSGHVMRCLTLADALRERGAQCRFVCRAHPGHLIDKIRQHGFEVHALPHHPDWRPTEADPAHAAWLGADWEKDAEETLVALQGERFDWLVVDHYALDARWERALRPHVGRIMAIDDLADRAHACDLLLDQNLQPGPDRYRGLVPENCELLLGPRYALLRPQFLDARKSLRARDGVVRRILVAFGGVDAQGATLLALEVIARLNRPEIAVDVVITSACPHRQAIEARCAALPNVRLHVDVEDMAGLMANADLAIGAGGSMIWERCCLGLPTLLLALADNQIEVGRQLAKKGAAWFLGSQEALSAEDLSHVLHAAVAMPESLSLLARQAHVLVDGLGARRLAVFLTRDGLRLRPATLDDAETLFHWRNHPEVRRWSAHPEPLELSEHRQWLEKTLTGGKSVLLIGECGEEGVGVVRFDFSDEREVIVSIYLNPAHLHQGWGRALLQAAERWIVTERGPIERFRARIMAGNTLSRALFEKAGYRVSETWMEKRWA